MIKQFKLELLTLISLLFFSAVQVTAQEIVSVSGIVSDSQGETIIGASIMEKGTSNGTITDLDGHYALKVKKNATLKVSFIGYKTQEVAVAGKREINFVLSEESQLLNEVVVVGYGTMRKKDLTGSVVQIKPSKIANEHPGNVEDILRNVPGLNVGLSNSAKGNASLEIRGQRSLYTEGGHNAPMIVLDGMIFYGELSEINPDDIGQIDILKDASSAAIYGAKSANGVIIVTTKKGRKGKPMINVSSNISITTKGADQKIYDAAGYLKYRQDYFESKGNFENPGKYAQPTAENLDQYGITLEQWRAYAPSSSSDTENWLSRLGLFPKEIENYMNGKSYDWYNHSFHTGISHDHNLSLSGAGERMNYYMSIGYLNNESLFIGDNYKAIRANLKLDGDVNKWLSMGVNVNFQDRSSNGVKMDPGSQYLNNTPYALPYDDQGNPVYQPLGDNGTWPGTNYYFEKQYMKRENGTTVLNTIFNTKVKLPFNITYSFNIAPRYTFGYERSFDSAEHPEGKNKHNGKVARSQGKNFDWSLNNTINWDYTFAKKHHVNVTLTQEAEEFRYWSDDIDAQDFQPTDALGFHNTGTANKSKSTFSSYDSHTTADALLARLFYAYDERYMVTASVRRDGYSAFGMHNPRATFPAVAIAWSFANEKFIKWEPLSMGKLRFSWGKNGNRSLKDTYLALSNLSALWADNMNKTQAYLDANGNLVEKQQLVVSRLGNPNLQWEKTSSWNVGVDFGFFDNRITGSVEYYVMPTTDMIMWQTVPNITGFKNIISNLGEVENKGMEFTLNSNNIKNSVFEWNTSVGFSLNRNEIKHLYYEYENVLNDTGDVIGVKERDVEGNGWFIGHDIGEIWDFKLVGIWQENEAEEAAKYGQRPGDPKIEDSHNPEEHKYTNEDKVFQGSRSPKFQWSMRNDFTLWNNLELSFNIYSKWGGKFTSTDYFNETGYTQEWTNSIVRKYWTPSNHNNKYARLGSIRPKNAEDTPKVLDNSFIRLENISVGYTLPKKLTKRFGIDKAKVFGSVRNVAVWMKNKEFRWDPEINGPAPRTYSFGLNVIL